MDSMSHQLKYTIPAVETSFFFSRQFSHSFVELEDIATKIYLNFLGNDLFGSVPVLLSNACDWMLLNLEHS